MLNKLKKIYTQAFLIAVAALTGCANYPSPVQAPENLVLILNQDITVEPGRARVFIQRGSVTRTGDLQTYEPSCDFEVVEVSQAGSVQLIRSGTFQVTRVYLAPPDVYAQTFELNQHYAMAVGEYLNTTYLTEFTLKSESQPDVLRLNCKIWSIDPFQRYLSTSQISQTLGAVATFKQE